MGTMKLLGVDPSLRNFGFALVEVDLETDKITPLEIHLESTAKTKHKQVRMASDNLARGRQLSLALKQWEKEAHMMVAEIPSGTQSAKAAYGLGIAVGVLSGHRIPLIEVSAREAKKIATGYATANKQEMIEWAVETWPDLPWLRHGKRLKNDNEHLADALAVVLAGVKTPQFQQAKSVMSLAASA